MVGYNRPPDSAISTAIRLNPPSVRVVFEGQVSRLTEQDVAAYLGFGSVVDFNNWLADARVRSWLDALNLERQSDFDEKKAAPMIPTKFFKFLVEHSEIKETDLGQTYYLEKDGKFKPDSKTHSRQFACYMNACYGIFRNTEAIHVLPGRSCLDATHTHFGIDAEDWNRLLKLCIWYTIIYGSYGRDDNTNKNSSLLACYFYTDDDKRTVGLSTYATKRKSGGGQSASEEEEQKEEEETADRGHLLRRGTRLNYNLPHLWNQMLDKGSPESEAKPSKKQKTVGDRSSVRDTIRVSPTTGAPGTTSQGEQAAGNPHHNERPAQTSHPRTGGTQIREDDTAFDHQARPSRSKSVPATNHPQKELEEVMVYLCGKYGRQMRSESSQGLIEAMQDAADAGDIVEIYRQQALMEARFRKDVV